MITRASVVEAGDLWLQDSGVNSSRQGRGHEAPSVLAFLTTVQLSTLF